MFFSFHLFTNNECIYLHLTFFNCFRYGVCVLLRPRPATTIHHTTRSNCRNLTCSVQLDLAISSYCSCLELSSDCGWSYQVAEVINEEEAGVEVSQGHNTFFKIHFINMRVASLGSFDILMHLVFVTTQSFLIDGGQNVPQFVTIEEKKG